MWKYQFWYLPFYEEILLICNGTALRLFICESITSVTCFLYEKILPIDNGTVLLLFICESISTVTCFLYKEILPYIMVHFCYFPYFKVSFLIPFSYMRKVPCFKREHSWNFFICESISTVTCATGSSRNPFLWYLYWYFRIIFPTGIIKTTT